jgi:superfamily II DNA or RNA helicase
VITTKRETPPAKAGLLVQVPDYQSGLTLPATEARTMTINTIEVSEPPRKSLGTRSPLILRPHQVDLINNIPAALRSGCRRLVAQAPTGFGKTIVGATMARKSRQIAYAMARAVS